MNAPFQFTPQATEDLDHIWSFIAADSEEAADRVETEIFRTCHLLAKSPLIGHRRPDITGLPVRFWTLPRYPSYVIVYRPEVRPIQIVAILHGRQDLKRRMSDRQRP